MDDDRIRQIRDEVLAALQHEPAGRVPGDLEARVAALERAVHALSVSTATAGGAVAVVATAHAHPSQQLFDVSGGSGGCVLEPDKPCVQSGQCRQLGH